MTIDSFFRILHQVKKPARYLGGEINSVLKPEAANLLHFCLAFPDTYEVGMSHLGLQLLYQILNERNDCFAERVFMPYPDMLGMLRQEKLLLSSLETQRPLREFQVLGFSLQYELAATNVLAMLECGGIPLWAEERTDSDPFVIGGGPSSLHPEAIAPFFDAFYLGDAEEGIGSLVEVFQAASSQGLSRNQVLDELHLLPGVYVPSKYTPIIDEQADFCGMRPLEGGGEKVVVERVIVPDLERVPSLIRPIVPNIEVVHSRLALEVMRGCVRGCRFCQAGYIYRPQRERSPERLLSDLGLGLEATGFEDVSLLSLSTADYCSIIPLLKQIYSLYPEDKLEVAFPSTRVDALSEDLLSLIPRRQRKRFTLAPEGGSQRLRDVINKGLSDEQIVQTVETIFRLGWKGVKLYFMLGLPTETDEDLQSIIDLARRLKAMPVARGRDVTVSVSTFVPKPHTPFQWVEQLSIVETERRQAFLAAGLRKIGVPLRTHPSFLSMLEGVLSRGDRRVANLIYEAYRNGCILDAWPEYINEAGWQKAFSSWELTKEKYLAARDVFAPLPWSHLSAGLPEDYFRREYQRALNQRLTHSCLFGKCSVCGICDDETIANVFSSETALTGLGGVGEKASAENEAASEKIKSVPAEELPESNLASAVNMAALDISRAASHERYVYRVQYSKTGPMRFMGHLETGAMIIRALKRSSLPVIYKSGFSPHPKVGFGPPLALGVESLGEFFDCYLETRLDDATVIKHLSSQLPRGLEIVAAYQLAPGVSSIQGAISSQHFQVLWAGPVGGIAKAALVQGQRKEVPASLILRLDTGELSPRTLFKAELSSQIHSELESLPSLISQINFVFNTIKLSQSADDSLNWAEECEIEPIGLSFLHTVNGHIKTIRLRRILELLTGCSLADLNVLKTETIFFK